MSEYQRYEFMTVDRPLTQEQLKEVNQLSSHIEASSTHAIIEYHHGDFKHNPIIVLLVGKERIVATRGRLIEVIHPSNVMENT